MDWGSTKLLEALRVWVDLILSYAFYDDPLVVSIELSREYICIKYTCGGTDSQVSFYSSRIISIYYLIMRAETRTGHANIHGNACGAALRYYAATGTSSAISRACET